MNTQASILGDIFDNGRAASKLRLNRKCCWKMAGVKMSGIAYLHFRSFGYSFLESCMNTMLKVRLCAWPLH